MASLLLNTIEELNTGGNIGSITHSNYVTPAGGKKVLVVNVTNQDDNSTCATCTCTYDGNAMTEIDSVQANVYNDIHARTTAFWIALGSSTPTGDIVATFSDSSSDGAVILAGTVTDVPQGAPNVVETAFHDGYTEGSIEDVITTTETNEFIITFMGFGNNQESTPAVNGTNHVDDESGWDATQEFGWGLGHRQATTATGYTQGWGHDNASSWMLITVSFKNEVAVGMVGILMHTGVWINGMVVAAEAGNLLFTHPHKTGGDL